MSPKHIAHYTMLEKLGEGGMGVVYKARDTHLDRFVAIKVLPAGRMAGPARKARFFQEAKSASALNHPNIITVHDVSSEDGQDYIVMEYVEGKTLDQVIPRTGMRLGDALKIGIQAADALARAHAAGIVHRDLKPANIMVDEHGLVKVLDFGLAKLTERTVSSDDEATATVTVKTDEGAIVGTAAYMSPEQAEAKPVDARSDIFSFGAVLYEMITGQRAFKGDSKMSTLAGVLRNEPAPLDAEVPREMDRIIRRCLRKEPDRRFQTMADLKVALEELKEIIYAAGATPALWRVKVSGGKPRRLPLGSEEARYPAVSPQARRLVYARSISYTDIYRADLSDPAANPVRVVSSTLRDEQPQVSSNGNRIVFVSDRSGNQEIWISDIDDSNQTQITSFGGAAVVQPVWSPDGTLILFHSNAGGKWANYVVSTQGGAPKPLNIEPAGMPSSWSRDGKSIYVTVVSGAQPGVWRGPAAGGPALQVTKAGRRGVESPDGKYLYYVKGPGINCSLYRVPLAGGDEVQVLEGLFDDHSFAPTDQGIHYLPIRAALFGRAVALHYHDFGAGASRPASGLRMLSRFDLSADGRYIFFANIDKHNSDLMLVENFR